MTAPDFSRLDDGHIAAMAEWAAGQLHEPGVARVQITPGDMTAYDVIVIDRDVPEHTAQGTYVGILYRVVLANSFGAAYPWDGGPVDPSYAGAKWCNHGAGQGPRLWAGEVMARFLNHLSPLLPAQSCLGDHVFRVADRFADGRVLHRCENCPAEVMHEADGGVVPVGEDT